MDIVRFTINNPVKIAVGVILVCLFGTLALFQIPIQLTPNVDEPKVTVTTRWPGKNAREVESEIVDRQEEKLKGISGLRKMTSVSREGEAEITLEFFVGTDRDRALRDVDEKINQVSGYPEEVEEPEIVAADAALETPIAWLLFRSKDGGDVSTLRDFVWDEIKPILERVKGLASIDVYGGREREVHIELDPALLAARGLTLRNTEDASRSQNVNVSAGTVVKGKRDFIYRTVGEYETPEDVENTVIAYHQGGPIFVRDVAKVVKTHEKQRTFVNSKGESVLAIPARRETGANVIDVMRGLKEQIARVNKEVIRDRGLEMELLQVYDETIYIHSAIDLVRKNLIVGGILAVIVLLAFLRSGRATAVVAVSIPISVIGTFLAITLLGRNLNVVMLAGMAFAVGMVVDNAVVVLENIYRHRQIGKTAFEAAQDGATEVWGAILASTLTTMAVFLPVIFIEEEAGQLFRDIAIAISAGVALSLLVAVMVIPTLSARVLGRAKKKLNNPGRDAGSQERGGRFSGLIADFVSWINRRIIWRMAVIVVFLVGSLLGSYCLMPPSDYLPTGNRNLVFGFVITEPGLSVEQFKVLAEDIKDYLSPYWSVRSGTPEADNLPPVMMPVGDKMVGVKPAPIDNFFFGSFQYMCFMGATSQDDLNVKPLAPLMHQAAMSSKIAVGSIAYFFQTGLFGDIRSSGTVEVEIRSDDLNKVNQAASLLFGKFLEANIGFVRPKPNNFDLPQPEIRNIPDRVRTAEAGMNVSDLGFILAAAVDGAYIGEFRDEGDEVDLKIKFVKSDGSPVGDIKNVPVYTPVGGIVPLSSLVTFQEVGAPQEIYHFDEMPGVGLEIRPPGGITIETVTEIVEKIVADMRGQGSIDPSVQISLAGNADKLVQTRAALFGRWTGFNTDSLLRLLQSRGFLALVVVYLLMAALFESFIHPLAILLTVPLAMVGGFGGLKIVHEASLANPIAPIQQFDVVTMLGFVILLGIVVNNAILIVHQTLNYLKRGMDPTAALHQSVRTRIRPIFMTAFTSIGGMLPLALMQGAGSELYRGLASVMVGGLLISTLFTIILVPVVFSMFLNLRIRIMQRLGRETAVPASDE
ncbi:MAG: efflux RND transporter permease subunit [Planctomycetota bacterium]|nr:MAG: efflux RND transporter permease subunit [Planctomycetota bacterium]